MNYHLDTNTPADAVRVERPIGICLLSVLQAMVGDSAIAAKALFHGATLVARNIKQLDRVREPNVVNSCQCPLTATSTIAR